MAVFSIGNFYHEYLLIYCCDVQECPIGTYKNVTGSDKGLCHPCPANELPHRAIYIAVRGDVIMVLKIFIFLMKLGVL